MKIHSSLLMIPAVALLATGCTETVAVRPPPPHPVVVEEEVAPPPNAPPRPAVRVEVVGPRPYAAAVYHRGHWRWAPRQGRWVWVAGHWAPA